MALENIEVKNLVFAVAIFGIIGVGVLVGSSGLTASVTTVNPSDGQEAEVSIPEGEPTTETKTISGKVPAYSYIESVVVTGQVEASKFDVCQGSLFGPDGHEVNAWVQGPQSDLRVGLEGIETGTRFNRNTKTVKIAEYVNKSASYKVKIGARGIEDSRCPWYGQDSYSDRNTASAEGSLKINYIPDTDKDRVHDEKDACPGTAEVVNTTEIGCPVDTDGDGVTDRTNTGQVKDKCPKQGASQYGVTKDGCPIQDDDNDGVPNPDDQCKQEFGSKDDGCPTITDKIINIIEQLGINIR